MDSPTRLEMASVSEKLRLELPKGKLALQKYDPSSNLNALAARLNMLEDWNRQYQPIQVPKRPGQEFRRPCPLAILCPLTITQPVKQSSKVPTLKEVKRIYSGMKQ